MLVPKIHVVSRKLIKPSPPTPNNLQIFKLSVFDQLAPPSYIKILLYFESKASQRCIQLEESLSHTLSKFYPLAGRLIKDEKEYPFIDCSDQGIEYLETKVDGLISELLHNQKLDVEILNHFLPQEFGPADSATTPLVTIQTNIFYCGGVAIGVCVSHKVADTSTLVSFINGWALANQGHINKITCPNFEVPSSFPFNNSLVHDIPELHRDNEMKIVTRRFLFDGSKIAKLKDMLQFKENRIASRVTIVSAVIWKALISVARSKHDELRPSILAPAMNLRGRSGTSSISENAFGNCWIPLVVRYNPQLGDRLEWSGLVTLLSNAVKNTADIISNAKSEEISLVGARAFAQVHQEMLRNDGADVFICTSWSRFPAYEADFGWGRPCWVSSTPRSYEMFTLLDSSSCGGGDGIEVWMCLNETDMNELERDTDISTFSSS